MPSGWDDAAEGLAGGWGEDAPVQADDSEQDEWASPPDDDGTIRLGMKPDAVTLRDALLGVPDLSTARIDASEVERLPAPVFQVLLVAMRDALSAGGRIRIVNPSFAFGLCFEAFGLGGDLEPFLAEYM